MLQYPMNIALQRIYNKNIIQFMFCFVQVVQILQAKTEYVHHIGPYKTRKINFIKHFWMWQWIKNVNEVLFDLSDDLTNGVTIT